MQVTDVFMWIYMILAFLISFLLVVIPSKDYLIRLIGVLFLILTSFGMGVQLERHDLVAAIPTVDAVDMNECN